MSGKRRWMVGKWKDATNMNFVLSEEPYNPRTSPKSPKNLGQGKNLSLTSGTQQRFFAPTSTLWQKWGVDNQFPREVMALFERHPFAETLVNTIVDFACGEEWRLVEKKIINGKVEYIDVSNPDIEDWLDRNDWDRLEQKFLYDALSLGNYFLEVMRSVSGNKIAELKHIDPTLIRIGKWKEAAVDYIKADWSNNGVNKQDPILAFDPKKPFAEKISVFHGKRYRPGAYRYGIPFWIGGEQFIRLMNEIPIFHLSGIRNGYGIKWHIKVPLDYWDDLPEDEQDKAEEEFQLDMDAYLAGAQNHGKTFFSYYKVDSTGKVIDGIIIEPVKAELYDDAFALIFDQAMIALCSSFGINPELAGVILQGKMSGNSGSGIRNAHNEYLTLKVPGIRKAYIDPVFEMLKKANGWPKNIYLDKVDYTIEKLDDNPEAVTSQSPGASPPASSSPIRADEGRAA